MGHFRRDFPKGLKGLLEGLSEGTSLEGTSRRDFSKGLLEGLLIHVFKGVGTLLPSGCTLDVVVVVFDLRVQLCPFVVVEVCGSRRTYRSQSSAVMEDSDTEDEELDEETIARERAAMRAAMATGPQEACEKADAPEEVAAAAAQHQAQQQALALTLTFTLALALALVLANPSTLNSKLSQPNPNPNPNPSLALTLTLTLHLP